MGALTAFSFDDEWLPVEDTSAPGRVRRCAAQLAQRIGFSEHRAGEVAIAATELATNLQRHAVHGVMLVRVRRDSDEPGVQLVAIDSGPGISDFTKLAADGESTRGTLGIGLGAVMRMASKFAVHSVPQRGTVIDALFYAGPAPSSRAPIAGFTRPITGETACGDAWGYYTIDGRLYVVLADGLGHGELAATAAREAVRTFVSDAPQTDIVESLQRMDSALQSTRGAAVGTMCIDRAANTIAFAGVGNVAAWVDDGDRRRALPSTPGIVGAKTKKVRPVQLTLNAGCTVVMHSDGLSSKWDLGQYPGLRGKEPPLIAATLLRDAGIRHDDASVVVA
ncbi:MAG TPA: ATP-binding SpoIIE family protein phosphatase [Candidatus Baltobacteraceae bacterium]